MGLFLCEIPGLSALLAVCTLPSPFATGYVEGDFTLVAPVSIAQIADVFVARGDRVETGEQIVRLEQHDAEIALADAEASLAQARSRLANLMEGRRPEELHVIEADLASARAQAAEAKRTMNRLADLAARGAATRTQRDDAATALEIAEAHVAEIEADLVVARMPARIHEIAAAEASVAKADAALEMARWLLDQRVLRAPAAGTIQDVIRTSGEIAGPAAPILSLLADDAVKLRLYIPETSFHQVEVGTELVVHCDGCSADATARVVFVSNQAEFTPPVIYSLESRQKLVYLVEAVPSQAEKLKPGQIVDVALLNGRK